MGHGALLCVRGSFPCSPLKIGFRRFRSLFTKLLLEILSWIEYETIWFFYAREPGASVLLALLSGIPQIPWPVTAWGALVLGAPGLQLKILFWRDEGREGESLTPPRVTAERKSIREPLLLQQLVLHFPPKLPGGVDLNQFSKVHPHVKKCLTIWLSLSNVSVTEFLALSRPWRSAFPAQPWL